MKRESSDSGQLTIQEIVKKSVFNQALKNVHTDIKNLLIKGQQNDNVFNIDHFNNTKGFRLSEINYQLSDPKGKQRPLAINSAKSLNTSNDFRFRKVKERHIITEYVTRKSNEKPTTPASQNQFEQQQKQENEKASKDTEDHKNYVKKISRYMFQMKIPQIQDQVKSKKIKMVPMVLTNEVTKISNQIKIQKSLNTTKTKFPGKKEKIPLYIENCLEHQLQSSDENDKKKGNSHIKFNKNFITPQKHVISYKSTIPKKLKYSLKSNKQPQNINSEEIIQDQSLPKPQIGVVKLEGKSNNKIKAIKQQKVQQKALLFIKRKKQCNPVEEDINLCGWELKDNLHDYYLPE